MNVQEKTKGFTIIEVVLVLAIAGLIFLMIFLALPALQRNQRDQARRADLGRLISAVQSYQSNNQGKRPAQVGGTGVPAILGTVYLENFRTPGDVAYTLAAGNGANIPNAVQPATEDQILYYVNRKCDSASPATGKTALVIWMENSGQFCQEL